MTVRKRGKRWQVDIRHKGLIDRPDRRLRDSTFRTQRDAVAFEARIRAELASGEYARRVRREENQRTFEEWWPDYLATIKTLNRPSSVSAKTSYWQNHIKPMFGKLHLHEFGVRHANKLGIRLGELGLSSTTYNLIVGTIRHMLSLAQSWEILQSVPDLPRMSTAGRGRIVWYMREDESPVLEAAEKHGLRTFVLAGLRLGLRKGELRALRWDDIDFTRNEVNVRRAVVRTTKPARDVWQEFTKGKEDRQIPMARDLAAALREHPRGIHTDQVFLGSGSRGEISNQELQTGAKRINRELDSHFFWHRLRHSFASQLVAAGVPLPTVQVLGGWKSIDMVLRYAHLAPDGSHLHDAIATLDRCGTSGAQAHEQRSEK